MHRRDKRALTPHERAKRRRIINEIIDGIAIGMAAAILTAMIISRLMGVE